MGVYSSSKIYTAPETQGESDVILFSNYGRRFCRHLVGKAPRNFC